MPRLPLRAPPGLSRLCHEVIFDDADAELEPELYESQSSSDLNTSARPRAVSGTSNRQHVPSQSFDFKTSEKNPDEGVPLLPFNRSDGPRAPNLQFAQYIGQKKKTISPEPNRDAQILDIYLDNGRNAAQTQHRSHMSNIAQIAAIPSPSASKTYKLFTGSPFPVPSSGSRVPRTRRRHPFANGFEVPQWRLLIIHLGICALAYLFLLIFVVASRGKSLFWARLYVEAGCGLLGALMGLSTVRLARRILEACTWATVIHQSRMPNSPGIRLKDLSAQSSNPDNPLGALRLLWDRHSYQGADREYRKLYDTRLWSFWILLFMANALISGMLPFMLARAVNIEVRVVHQHEIYNEVSVAADISKSDIHGAKRLGAYFKNDELLWTMAPFFAQGSAPSVVSFTWDNDTVYFSEVTLSQLVPGGAGLGTFKSSMTLSTDGHLRSSSHTIGVDLGAILRFPRWGLRIKCVKILEDIPHNIIPLSESNLTYLFTPGDTLRSLFQTFNLSFPESFEQPLNFSDVLQFNDTLPAGLNISAIALGDRFLNDGVTHSMRSIPLNVGTGSNGNAIVTLEYALVRLNTSFAPHGVFGVEGNFSMPDTDGLFTQIGYDAVACLELYEPWVLEVYNSSTRSPSSLRIVDKAATITDIDTDGLKDKMSGPQITDLRVKRTLNSTDLSAIFSAGHQNGVNQLSKDIDHGSRYIPSPMVISFAGGDGPLGYTQLSEVHYAESRALADAANVLPYLVGSGLSVARRYSDRIIADTAIFNVQMGLLIIMVSLMGIISGLFTPRLPLKTPRRGFDLYSWMSAFYARELIADDKPSSLSTKDLELPDIVEYAENLKFFYVV